MADLVAADVTVTQPIQAVFYPPIPITIGFASVAFGNGAKTYPSGGVPLAATKVGLKKLIGYSPPSLDLTTGYMAAYDVAAQKLRLYQCAGASTPMVELGHVAVPAVSFVLFVVGE